MDYIREYRSFLYSYNLSGALRITFGILFPAIALSYFNNLSAGIVVSLGAMCVGNTDNPGPIHHRRNGMLACMLIIFGVTLLTGLASGSPVMTGLLVLLFCWLFSMIGMYGARAGSIGVNALLIMVLNIDRRHHGLDIVWNAVEVLAGGAWYTALSLLLYSFRPFKLTQQALGECIESTAAYLRDKAAFYERVADYDRRYRELAAQQIDVHQKQELVRELLFKSRAIVRESTHMGRVMVMIFLDIVDLFERVMTSHQDYPMFHALYDDTPIPEQFRGLILEMAEELEDIGIAVKSGRPSVENPDLPVHIREVKGALERLEGGAANPEHFTGLRQIMESIEDIADRMHTLHGYTTYDLKLGKPPGKPEDYEKFVTSQDISGKLFLHNLGLGSNIFRHALRVSIATLAGYLVSRFLPLGHGYWILLTIIVILKPAYSLTKQRNEARLLGTLAGAVVGLLLLYFIKDRSVLFVLMILFMIGTYVFLRTNYLVCVTLMTPYVLLLFHLLYPISFRAIISDRVIDTMIGSAIAFLAGILIAPAWEHEQMLNYMENCIRGNLGYFRDIGAAFLGRPPSITQYKLSRKHAFVSLANLSDAFNRMLSEPRSKQRDVRLMHQFVVSNHMLTTHIATLSYYVPGLSARLSSPTLFGPVIDSIGNKLEHVLGLLENKSKIAEGQEGKGNLRTLNERAANQPALRPIADQFNFINKIALDLEKWADDSRKDSSAAA